MFNAMNRHVLFLALLFLLIPGAAICQTIDSDGVGLDEYDVTQYASVKSFSPRQIMFFDNNDQIIMACRNGKTKKQLDELGISYNESQIALLRAWRLLDRADDVYTTIMPILDSEKMSGLRALTENAARQIAENMEANLRKYIATLESEGFGGHAFSLLFSYVIDGLVWSEFRSQGLGVSTRVTADTPLWAGAVWAVFPPRASRCGTNSYSAETGYVSVNWSESAGGELDKLLGSSEYLKTMVDQIGSQGRLVDPKAVEALAPFNLIDLDGRPRIPIVRETAGVDLYDTSLDLSANIAALTLQTVPVDSLQKTLGLTSPAVALIIIYHELMWDLMEVLEGKGMIVRPRILTGDTSAAPEDVASLVFVVLNR